MDVIKELSEMKDTIAQEIAEANQRIRQSGGDLNAGDVEIIDKLTHSMKSLATTVAMLEAEESGGYSGSTMPYYHGGYPRMYRRDGYSGDEGYARNDGRYSREYRNGNGGYSRTGESMEHLRMLMDEAPDEKTRIEIKKLMEKFDHR